MAKHNDSGNQAESVVVDYLKKFGFKVIDQNWKTKWCEIDIVAIKHNRIYFVEVKYRRTSKYGGGFDYITPQKLRQMDLAARSWVEINNWEDEHQLSVAEVTGEDFSVEFIEELN